MDIVEFFKKQVDKWNEDQKCGICWDYGAPLVPSEMSNYKMRNNKDCCVHVFVTNLRYNKVRNRNFRTGLINESYCDYSFTVYAVKSVPMGINNYNESAGHPVEESKWNTVFKPIQDCIGCGDNLDFCEILGKDITIISESGEVVHNYLSNNYNGWKVTYTFRELCT